jgi:hypothetical protein
MYRIRISRYNLINAANLVILIFLLYFIHHLGVSKPHFESWLSFRLQVKEEQKCNLLGSLLNLISDLRTS